MDITFKITHGPDGIKISYADQHIDLAHALSLSEEIHVDLEIDDNDIDLRDFDEDQMRNHLESIYGTMYQEGEEMYMKEHLEEEGYFVADCIDDAEEEIEEYINEHTDKWVVDPDEIDEVDTMEFVSEALNKKGYYILRIPSFLQALIGGLK